MKKFITFQKLTLINFKGIKNLTIDLDLETNIFGANGTGKTTISDAANWLLFGKDSADRKDFEIKTLDKYGIVIPQIDHEVSATLLVDNETLTLRRVLKENWVKKRGSEMAEFAGNVTDLYWNEVPVSVAEFTKKVNDILNEQVFKMITSPTYFNSIKWQDRRNLLIQVFGEVSNEDIAKGNPAYELLLTKLTQGKTLEDYKAQLSASIKKAKEDIKNIPARVDEVYRGRPEEIDFVKLTVDLEAKDAELQKVDKEIGDINLGFQAKLNAQKGVKIKVNNLKAELETIEQQAKNEATERLKPNTSVLDGLVKDKESKTQELQSFKNSLATLEGKKSGLVAEIETLKSKIETKRNDWAIENAKELTFNDNDFHCPTCKRAFESGDVETKKTEALANFKANKTKALNEINASGKSLADEKANKETEVKTLEERIQNEKSTIETAEKELQIIVDKINTENNKTSSTSETQSLEVVYNSILALNHVYQVLTEEKEKFEATITDDISTDNSALIAKRQTLVSEIDSIKTQLQAEKQIKACDDRIKELHKEETTLAQQIANVEKEQFVIENFIKDKVDRLEETVNSKFKYVKFKMFDLQINGGLKETCEATVNGVPYSDVNTASKINAGLDIINVLSEYYKVSAPIFVDNAESVHTLIDTDSQLIRLVVSEAHKTLLVETKELAA